MRQQVRRTALALAGMIALGAPAGVAAQTTGSPPPAGQITPVDAVDVIAEADPALLVTATPTRTPDGERIDPALVVTGDVVKAERIVGTARASMSASYKGGIDIGVASSAVRLVPISVSADAARVTLAGDSAAVFANTANSVDTLVRPTPLGLELFEQIRGAGAPVSYSWRVLLRRGQRLVRLDDGAVAVVQNAPGNSVNSTEPVADPAAGTPEATAPAHDSGALLEEQRDDVGAALDAVGEDVVAMIGTPSAHDASGASVDARLSVDGAGDIVTMHVDHLRAGVVYPVVADPSVTDAAAIVADWLCALAFADNPEGYISTA